MAPAQLCTQDLTHGFSSNFMAILGDKYVFIFGTNIVPTC
jgi:hypothetical protein